MDETFLRTEGEDSIYQYTCKLCNAQVEIARTPQGHAWDTDYTVDLAASCKTDGSKSIHCSVDGCTEQKEVTVISASDLPHTWSQEYTVDQEATCYSTGQKSKHCLICDAINEETVEEIPMTDHNLTSSVAKEATCTEKGSKTTSCSRCDYTVTDAIILMWKKLLPPAIPMRP